MKRMVICAWCVALLAACGGGNPVGDDKSLPPAEGSDEGAPTTEEEQSVPSDPPFTEAGTCEAPYMLAVESRREDNGTFRVEVDVDVEAGPNDFGADYACNAEVAELYASDGREAVIAFTAPSAGSWVFWGEGMFLWGLSAIEGCAAGEEPLECRAVSDFHSPALFDARVFSLELERGETVHLVADGCPPEHGVASCTYTIQAVPPQLPGALCDALGVSEYYLGQTSRPLNDCVAGTFCRGLDASTYEELFEGSFWDAPASSPGVCTEATAPVFIESEETTAYVVDRQVRLKFLVRDDTHDLDHILYRVDDPRYPLVDAERGTISTRSLGNDRFVVEAIIPVEFGFAGARTIELTVVDRTGLTTDTIRELPISDIPILNEGEACEPSGFDAICEPELRCWSNVCTLPQAPTLSSVRAHMDATSLVLIVEGRDSNRDAKALDVDAFRDDQLITDARISFSAVEWEGDAFTAVAVLPIEESPDRIEVHVEDKTYLRSARLAAEVGELPLVGEGDICSPGSGSLGVCRDDAFDCVRRDHAGHHRCEVVETTCPAEWDVIELAGVYSGSLGDAADVVRACGSSGASPDQAFRFVATEAGEYTFSVSNTGDPIHIPDHAPYLPAPGLIARSHCAISAGLEGDQVCGDLEEWGDEGTERLSVTLEASEAIYLFVEGSDDVQTYRLAVE